MIKEAIDRILELAEPNTVQTLNGRFSDKKMTRMDDELRAAAISMNTLSSLVDYIKGQEDFKHISYIVQVVSPTYVKLISALDRDRMRETLVEVNAEIPEFPFGQFVDNERFIIMTKRSFLHLQVM